MTKSFLCFIAIILSLIGTAAAQTPGLRETPVVRAFQKNKDAVVSIAAKQAVRADNDLFGMRLEDFFGFQPRRERTLSSLGSGFIIHPRGYIVTNSHVIAGADEITIIMPDDQNTSYTAHKIAVDPTSDLAVVKIDTDHPMPTVTLGYSDDLMIGEPVLAIGNPYGYRQTLTDGIISAIHRDLQLDEEFTLPEMIQISAPINFGNSGGPLININGEVIGINTAIRKAAQNIGFAIPVDRLREKLPALLDIDRLRRTDLGLEVGDVRLKSPQIDAENQSVCVVIRKIRTDSAALAAGLAVGDIIVALDGQKLRNSLDFYLHLVESSLGREVRLDLVRPNLPGVYSTRAGKEFSATLTLHARPKPDGAALAWSMFGIKFEPLNEATIRKNRLAGKPGQLVAIEVQPNSPAGTAGIAPGDVLISLGRGDEVASLDHLGLMIENVKSNQPVTLNFTRTRKVGLGFQEITQFSVPLRARAADTIPAKQPEGAVL
jgi:serine protease Do